MSNRNLRLAAAQLGPIHRGETRSEVIERLLKLLKDAHDKQVQLIVYPERVPGVPRLLAKRLSPAVESFLIELVTPNLKYMPHAVQALLDSESK